jgi:hypothetical protein
MLRYLVYVSHQGPLEGIELTTFRLQGRTMLWLVWYSTHLCVNNLDICYIFVKCCEEYLLCVSLCDLTWYNILEAYLKFDNTGDNKIMQRRSSISYHQLRDNFYQNWPNCTIDFHWNLGPVRSPIKCNFVKFVQNIFHLQNFKEMSRTNWSRPQIAILLYLSMKAIFIKRYWI